MSRVILVLCWLILACTASDMSVQEKFATTADAAHAMAFERRVIPQWMPQSATDLRITANLDSGTTVLAFSVPQGFDLEKHLGTGATEGSISDRGMRGQAGTDEWPECARTPNESCHGYKYFVLDGDLASPRSYVAADTSKSKVYWLGR